MVVIEVLILLCTLVSAGSGVFLCKLLNDIKNIKIYSKEIYDREGWL